MLHVFDALAEFENEVIRERAKAGPLAVRARGCKGDRISSMFDSYVCKAAAMLTNSKVTKMQVAAHFNVTRTTLNASLKRKGMAA